MIEKFFIKGLRVIWPGGPVDAPSGTDGAIILNPTRAPQPMISDGMDGELYDATLPNITALGLRKGQPIPLNWLSYAPGRTTKRMLSAGDVLTGYMSGCPIALWTENGMRYAGHVGTVDANPPVNQLVRRTFAQFMPQDVTGFNPAAAWQPAEIVALTDKFKKCTPGAPRILALVTTTGEFYSIIMFSLMTKDPKDPVPPGTFVVGSAKRVPPLNYQGMRQYLLPNG